MSYKGLDVSYWQGNNINWSSVAGEGYSFVYVKSTEGSTRKEPNAKVQAQGAKDAGLKAGYYHFARPEIDNGIQEANFFLSVIQDLPPQDLLPVLDIEENKSNLSAAQLTKWIEDFYSTVIQSQTLNNMVLYSYKPFFDQYLLPSTILADSKLWLAQYTSTPSLPKGWNHYSIWQYSNKGVVKGIQGNVDLNVADELPLV